MTTETEESIRRLHEYAETKPRQEYPWLTHNDIRIISAEVRRLTQVVQGLEKMKVKENNRESAIKMHSFSKLFFALVIVANVIMIFCILTENKPNVEWVFAAWAFAWGVLVLILAYTINLKERRINRLESVISEYENNLEENTSNGS